MRAFDVLFGELGDLRSTPGGRSVDPAAEPTRAGWTGSHGTTIDADQWPRGPWTGLPMMHVITLLLPEEYRRKGPEFVAVSFFQGEGQFATQFPQPLRMPLARPHPQSTIFEDMIGGKFALIWLTQAEFDAGPSAPPAEARNAEQAAYDDEGANAWDHVEPLVEVWIRPRDWDVNVGIAPSESWTEDAYVDRFDSTDEAFAAGAEASYDLSHLGGTTNCVQAVPQELTPYYLELEEISGTNFGGGNCQIDLESGVFDWACG
ncbi:hypothetical protein ACHIPZ_23180 [Antrihabitans sp. NCIMB 15449]|uniref:DUF1963 domain-containing protein n=1 Tax=Antrihabitans spumae TaxID=3373370 RepID=A0ABW7JVU8_9NOCA